MSRKKPLPLPRHGAGERRTPMGSFAKPETESAAIARRCRKGDLSLEEGARILGIPYNRMKDMCKPATDDPLLQLAGVLESDLNDVAERHDDYLGQQLLEELNPGDHD